MDHQDLMIETEEHVKLMLENKQLEERIKLLTNGPQIRYQHQTLKALANKPSNSAATLLIYKTRADITRANLKETKEVYIANVEKRSELRKRFHQKYKSKIEDSNKFAAESDEFIKLTSQLGEEREKLAQLKIELARVKGILAAKELICKAMER